MRCLCTTASDGVEPHLAKTEREIARTGLDVDRLRDPVEPFGRHVHLMRARLHVLGRQRRRSDELPIDEHLRPGYVGLDPQRTEFGTASASGVGAAPARAGASGSERAPGRSRRRAAARRASGWRRRDGARGVCRS